MNAAHPSSGEVRPYWTKSPEALCRELGSGPSGIRQATAARRIAGLRRRQGRRPEWMSDLLLFFRQFKSPLVLLLVLAVVLSLALGDYTNSLIIFSILFLSSLLGFWQERHAGRAVRRLQSMVRVSSQVRRDGVLRSVQLEEVLPGDVVLLNAGSIVPGDGILLWEKDIHINEAVLTGESYPVEKDCIPSADDTPPARRRNVLYQGTSVMSGEADMLVVCTGGDTELGRIAARMAKSRETTSFQQGISRFGFLLMRLTFLLSAGLLIFNLFLGRPVVESALFAIALAVGLTPELLPAIVVTTLSAGASRLVKAKVIVKELEAIQNLGAIDILCSDKTGTLTTGEVRVHSACGIDRLPNTEVLRMAYLNAVFESGFNNPMDEAIRRLSEMSTDGFTKFDEVPYDFTRKRLSIVVENAGRHLMITKGALRNILEVCTQVQDPDGTVAPLDRHRKEIDNFFEQQSRSGLRTIGIAVKDVTGDPVINMDDEQDMTFLGFLFLHDPAKEGVRDTIAQLNALGIAVKVITGDNRPAAAHLAETVGLDTNRLVTGEQLERMGDLALARMVAENDVFAEIEPFQKERLVKAMRRNGNVVGYIGDGINDAAALKAADVGISVDTAVDVAKDAADLVLLEKNLDVLHAGIVEGRKTYLNTLKYIFITTSANFGNMFSLAGISLMIPFLPMLPKQILFLNFLSDIPALFIASDRVDPELLRKPQKWNIRLIRNFMFVFGLQSSIFDYLTFTLILWVFHVGESRFQTAWFIESVLTEVFILLIIRTRRPFFKSRPSYLLLGSGIVVALFVVSTPYWMPFEWFGFEPLPWPLLLGMVGVALTYGLISELLKKRFYRQLL
jgi:Mg2+-importing ATPase